jgi:hypothetical protein
MEKRSSITIDLTEYNPFNTFPQRAVVLAYNPATLSMSIQPKISKGAVSSLPPDSQSCRRYHCKVAKGREQDKRVKKASLGLSFMEKEQEKIALPLHIYRGENKRHQIENQRLSTYPLGPFHVKNQSRSSRLPFLETPLPEEIPNGKCIRGQGHREHSLALLTASSF